MRTPPRNAKSPRHRGSARTENLKSAKDTAGRPGTGNWILEGISRARSLRSEGLNRDGRRRVLLIGMGVAA